MTNEEILLEILDKVNLSDSSFMDALVKGEMIRAGIGLSVSLVFLIIILTLFLKFNKEFDIIENLSELFKSLKPDAYGRNSQRVDKRSSYDDEVDIIAEIKNILKDSPILRYVLSIFVVWFELSMVLKCITMVTTNCILLANCFLAPERIFIDYLASLF